MVRYAVAVAAAAAAVLFREALVPLWGLELPYITLFPAIMLSAWLGGFGPGITTTLLCSVAAEYLWIEPRRSWAVANPPELLGLATFVAIGGLISALNEAWRRGIAAVAESEERLRVTLTSIGDAVITTDERGRVTRLNAIAEALTGWTVDEAAGRPLHEVFVIINEESREHAHNPVYRVLHEGTVTGLANHTLLIARDGREIPIDDSAAPIRTDDGPMTGVVMVFRDIADRRRAEREHAAFLERERAARRAAETATEQLRVALEAGRMGTWEYTIRKGEVKWSAALEGIHGMAPGTFPGTFEAFRAEIHPDDRDHVLAAIQAAAAGRHDHHVEYRIVWSDGSVRWVEGRGQLFLDDAGEPMRMVGVCSDITERKAVDEERARLLIREEAARAEIERASRLKDEFLAVLSHELRTPLNAVLGYAHLLSAGTLSAERTTHAVAAIQRSAQAQARMVDALLDLSRIMAGKLELDLERLDIADVLHAALDAVRPEADAKGITIEIETPQETIALVGDAGRLQEVFWNLLSNAIKFTPRGGSVVVSLQQRDDHVAVQFADTGQGIGPEFLPYVFDRFKQGDSRSGRPIGGLGLGLALVREMVHAHGGIVMAESPGEDRGATFTVTLPLSTAATRLPPQPLTAADHGSVDRLPGLTVLVVDDEAEARDLLAILLESRGASVRTAGSAAEALAAIRERRPDVLLADLRMPGEDGYALIRTVRARERDERAVRLPAIAVTADAGAANRDRAIASGYDGHVAKPVDLGALMRAIVTVTGLQSV
ncbi:MAG: PAS domain S-box protein [Acidobacteria bacterium]|nr:PAS domain S-box protein [Acidobacteriota bacterium]